MHISAGGGGKITSFEVFIITTQPQREILDKIIPAKEVIPPNEAFGYWAWTYKTLDRAKRKYNALEHEAESANSRKVKEEAE